MSLQSQRYGTLSLEGTDTALKAWWLSTATYHLRDFAGEPGESWEQTDSAGSSELSGIPCNEWLDETNIKKKKKVRRALQTQAGEPGGRAGKTCLASSPYHLIARRLTPTFLLPRGSRWGLRATPRADVCSAGCLAPNRYSAVMTRGRLRNPWRTGSQTGTRDRVRAATGFSGREGEKGSNQEPSRMPGFGIKPPGEKTVRKRNGGYKQPNDGSGAGEAREGRVLK